VTHRHTNFIGDKINLGRSLTDQYDACQILTEIWREATFFCWHNSFDGRRVCNRTVWWWGYLSLTNWVGYDKLRFHERCMLLLAVYYWVCSSAAYTIGIIIINNIIISDKWVWIKQHNEDLKELRIPNSNRFIQPGRKKWTGNAAQKGETGNTYRSSGGRKPEGKTARRWSVAEVSIILKCILCT